MPARTCEICGERRAICLCQECGSAVCQLCERGWLCKAPAEKFKGAMGEENNRSFRLQPILFLIGFAIVLTGFLLVFLGSSTPVSSRGCVLWPVLLIVAYGLRGSNDLYLALSLVLVTTFSVPVFS